MRDVNEAVEAWVSTVDGAHADELADHLYCLIEHHTAQGLPIDEAYELAVSQLGDPVALSIEHTKNREETMEHARHPILHALFFAAMMLASSWVLAGADGSQQIMLLWVAAWFATSPALAARAHDDVACLRRRLARG